MGVATSGSAGLAAGAFPSIPSQAATTPTVLKDNPELALEIETRSGTALGIDGKAPAAKPAEPEVATPMPEVKAA